HLRRSVLDEEHGKAVGRDLAHRRQHQAVSMRVDEMRVDPALASVGQLPDIQLARGEQRLAVLTVDRIAVDIPPEKAVVRPQALDLGDGVVKGAPIPEANVVEQVLMPGDVDAGLGIRLEFYLLDALLQTVSAARGMNMLLDVGPLKRDLVGLHV